MNGPSNPSRTALGVATHRAAHQVLDGGPKILDDPIAARLLGEDTMRRMRADVNRLRRADAMALRSHVLVRSRYAEDRLAKATARGVRQMVTLGAGYDSFAYRQPAWANDLRLFEVDQSATQADKRRRLAAAGVSTPENLEFVAIDFERTSLADGLAASSLDFGQPTFFSCLGVLVYLTEAAVDAIFRLVAGFPPGSEIAFTFSPTSRKSLIALRAGAAGEPWRSHIDPEQLVRKLAGLGFGAIDILEPADAERAYFTPRRKDGLAPPRSASIASAVVGDLNTDNTRQAATFG